MPTDMRGCTSTNTYRSSNTCIVWVVKALGLVDDIEAKPYRL